MKQAITTTTLFKVVLAFTFLFSGFLALTITYNKVYKLKNEMVSIIEKYEGLTSKSLNIINNYLNESGYNTTFSCENGQYGVYDLENNRYELARNGRKYYYCLSSICPKKGNPQASCPSTVNKKDDLKVYYDVVVFYRFNLPFFGDLTTFRIKGQTKGVKLYRDNQLLK